MKQFKHILVLFLMIACFPGAIWGSDQSDQFEGVLYADLNGDMRLESVEWRKFAILERGDYYQLIVKDDNGNILWQGPRVVDDNNPFVFSALDYGISLPEILTDIDNDGYIELLAPHTQSDVSPTSFRRLRWVGNRFQEMPSYSLMMKPNIQDRLFWMRTNDDFGIWVSGLEMKNGLIEANIIESRADGTGNVALADISFTRQGATIDRWIKPLYIKKKQISSKKYNSYRARLSNGDHYNSRGKRLKSMAHILQQDRARFHKGYGDREDSQDDYFQTLQERTMIPHYQIYAVGGTSYQTLEDSIVNGTPLVEVTLRHGRLEVRLLSR